MFKSFSYAINEVFDEEVKTKERKCKKNHKNTLKKENRDTKEKHTAAHLLSYTRMSRPTLDGKKKKRKKERYTSKKKKKDVCDKRQCGKHFFLCRRGKLIKGNKNNK